MQVAEYVLQFYGQPTLGMPYPLIMELWIDDGIRSERTWLPGS
jgi:hypothetical protein